MADAPFEIGAVSKWGLRLQNRNTIETGKGAPAAPSLALASIERINVALGVRSLVES